MTWSWCVRAHAVKHSRHQSCPASFLKLLLKDGGPLSTRPSFITAIDWATFDVYTLTDSQGRYEICGLPRGSGRLGAGDCNDAVNIIPTEITGDTNVLDVDLTSFNKSCPSTPRKRRAE